MQRKIAAIERRRSERKSAEAARSTASVGHEEFGWTHAEVNLACVNALPSEADLQLLFARLNYEFFNGEVPDCRIRYNERFSNSAGRITYGRQPDA